ncbi:hypothetical protein HDC34_000892 [Pseudoclavibacter sp. JAI123]|uniref:hypothetical protein n=1 Tax=Pseudoclavibacter sp. JAI123 TaxID=2723065 RepID=UPI000CE76633|nr:hypothetical protein [Pseudoclavibacter sp. JAI123]NYF12598.1 hypothetical protein [Pseudoclavibacter sp. JAI123]PPG33404.1 hypothetical protein C5B97_01985 [Pseudoclavibacter sp. RFBB5]
MNSPRHLARARDASTRLASQPSVDPRLQLEQQHRAAQLDPFDRTLPRRAIRAASAPLFIPGFRYYPPVSRLGAAR